MTTDVSEPDVAVDIQTERILEALLFASSEPLSEAVLAAHLPEGTDIQTALASLAERYEERGVNLLAVGDGWALRTAPDLAFVLRREAEVQRRMSRAALETMAIIAYHQPVTRGEIEQIRGVAVSKGTLDILFEQNWIQPRGRRNTPGRPATWVTTPSFLDHFGLSGIGDLPGIDELKAAGLLDTAVNQTSLGLHVIAGEDDDEGGEADDGNHEAADGNVEQADEPLLEMDGV
jgi:segregation and condensation protein B